MTELENSQRKLFKISKNAAAFYGAALTIVLMILIKLRAYLAAITGMPGLIDNGIIWISIGIIGTAVYFDWSVQETAEK